MTTQPSHFAGRCGWGGEIFFWGENSPGFRITGQPFAPVLRSFIIFKFEQIPKLKNRKFWALVHVEATFLKASSLWSHCIIKSLRTSGCQNARQGKPNLCAFIYNLHHHLCLPPFSLEVLIFDYGRQPTCRHLRIWKEPLATYFPVFVMLKLLPININWFHRDLQG